jgi:hypothetical protein
MTSYSCPKRQQTTTREYFILGPGWILCAFLIMQVCKCMSLWMRKIFKSLFTSRTRNNFYPPGEMRTSLRILDYTAVQQEYLFNSVIDLVNISHVVNCGSGYELGNIQCLPLELLGTISWCRACLYDAYISVDLITLQLHFKFCQLLAFISQLVKSNVSFHVRCCSPLHPIWNLKLIWLTRNLRFVIQLWD